MHACDTQAQQNQELHLAAVTGMAKKEIAMETGQADLDSPRIGSANRNAHRPQVQGVHRFSGTTQISG